MKRPVQWATGGVFSLVAISGCARAHDSESRPAPATPSTLIAAVAPVAPTPTVRPVYRVGGEVSEPVEVSRSHPNVPDSVRGFHLRGVLILEAVIEADGTVSEIHSVRPIPRAAEPCVRYFMDSLKTWRYKPAMFHGQPVAVHLTVTVTDIGC